MNGFIPIIASIAISLPLLIFGSHSDVKKRSINSFTFLPIFILALAFYILDKDVVMSIVTILSTVAVFIKPNIYVYIVLPLIIIGIGFFDTINLLTILIVGMFLLTGFGELLFGIGDIKGIVSVVLLFSSIPRFNNYIPFSIVFVFFIAVASGGALLYFVVYARLNGLKLRGLNVLYDEHEYLRNTIKYQLKDTNSGKVMIYRVPFLVPILVSTVLSLIAQLIIYASIHT
ncbi:hypothetical protein [Thermoplasma volcanium GSS1]|uniref:Prepilin type IV endopeptidase peptidase domain-containing protein n=1 Tax=Thermoplasma volcanium (strain ATCC 51530 / DSM 4299 / JCM 9571 / NBRC 15438 / GSS1) TaxID=273116 RepID=Q978Q1_THEVO|nr:hypothetical protein [Thermoplasma volcanium]BAB60506.1 hypothetical protein [Thermoplasma volcanium GSS1]